jgi:hypothetical protein
VDNRGALAVAVRPATVGSDVGSGADFGGVPSATVADVLGRGCVMDIGVRPLWRPPVRLAGPAYTPGGRAGEVLAAARARLAEEARETLDDWEAAHRLRIENTLRDKGFAG